jgi:hypothetical protein
VVTWPRRTCTLRSVRNESAKRMALCGHPCSTIRCSRRFLRRASKAPCTSRVTMVTCWLSAHAAYVSCVSAAVRSAAERFGRAPPCCGLRMLCVMAVHAIRLATVRSSPFPMHDRSAMGLQDRGDVRSVFPAFGIIVTSASFHCAGKWLSSRHRWKILRMSSPTCAQQARSSRTVERSVPGEVLETPIVFRSASSSEMCVFHGRVAAVSWSGQCPRSSSAVYRLRTSSLSASAFSKGSEMTLSLTTRGVSWLSGVSLCQAITLKRSLSSFALSMICLQYCLLACLTTVLKARVSSDRGTAGPRCLARL